MIVLAPFYPATDLNLDDMNEDELKAFIKFIGLGQRPLTAAWKLFPGRDKGIISATISLRDYALNKLSARQCRRHGGYVATALIYESYCDRIYRRDLPEWAKGW